MISENSVNANNSVSSDNIVNSKGGYDSESEEKLSEILELPIDRLEYKHF